MITISLCMIVKNEERVLARCLDSIRGLMDEIVIVDTGSTDSTREIALRYTDKVYDFKWINDFSAARNFAFSKAAMEYIYTADADEIIDRDNYEKFKILKEALIPGIEIVQMKYGNQLSEGTVYNFDMELRPKLFKRLREFVWIEPIHETVRTEPVVFDSDIVITHLPEANHSGRDLEYFVRLLSLGEKLSDRLEGMYIRELYLNGKLSDFDAASGYFENRLRSELSEDRYKEISCVLARRARLSGNVSKLMKYATKLVAGEGCSEICNELGHFYEDEGDCEEGCMWYYNAAFESVPIIDVRSGGRDSLQGLVRCYEALGMKQEAGEYRDKLEMLDKMQSP